MNYSFIAIACAMLVGCAFALQLPDVKDHPDKPIDPKQIKNATLTFFNNGTYIYMLEVPCEAYLTPGRGGQQQGRSQSSGSAHDEEDDEHEDDEDANGSSQMTPQQRQRQQQQQRQRQQQQAGRGGRQSQSGGSQSEHHLNPDELRQAHEGTECECHCKNHDGEELDDVVTVSFGGKGHGQSSPSSQRGGNSSQQRQQQQRQQQQRQQQQGRQQRGGQSGASSSHHGGEGEGPELVYPQQPRAGQKCIFFEEGEWENDDDELIEAVGPDNKTPGEPEDEVLEKCTFNFKKGGAGQQQQSSSGSQGGQQVSLQCIDNHGEQDQYVVRIQNGELKPKLTNQQKQESQKGKSQKPGQQGRSRNQ